MVSAGNRTEQSSYATLNPELCTTRFDPGLRAPPHRAALQCRSQAHPGDRDRDGHTHSRAQAGTEGPRRSWDTSPGPLAGDGGGGGPRGGQSQPLRPVSTPRVLAGLDFSAHVLFFRHWWLDTLETEYWARWTFPVRQCCCSQALVF